MLFVPINKLRPGMVVAKPICQARNKVYFVQKGFALDGRTIARLRDLSVRHLWIECGGLDAVSDRISDAVEDRRAELTGALTNSIDRLRHKTDAMVDCGNFERRVGDLLGEILDDPTHEPILATMTGDCGALVRHLSNCCYLSLLLGTHLSGYVRHQRRRVPPRLADDIRQLGVGAFLHDMGKVRLSDEAQEQHVLAAAKDDVEYQSHVRVGADMLRGKVSPLALYMVIHHHQRYDGKGFPRIKPRDPGRLPAGLEGEKIHVFARILAVADAFDHLLSTPDGPRATIQALHALQQPEYEGWFDPVVVAALNRLVPPFMIGTVVTLTDDAEAVVVANHPDSPCEPTVRLMHGDAGAPDAWIDDDELDLRYSPGLAVAFADGLDVRPYHFRPPEIHDGAMAYWGVRARALQSVHVDPAMLAAAD
jgi:hypothetical protein